MLAHLSTDFNLSMSGLVYGQLSHLLITRRYILLSDSNVFQGRYIWVMFEQSIDFGAPLSGAFLLNYLLFRINRRLYFGLHQLFCLITEWRDKCVVFEKRLDFSASVRRDLVFNLNLLGSFGWFRFLFLFFERWDESVMLKKCLHFNTSSSVTA